MNGVKEGRGVNDQVVAGPFTQNGPGPRRVKESGEGLLGKLDREFGGDLEAIIHEINTAIAA